jgi:ribose/xylose/arabinose/galactoside ABC-type transport system permease subunit
MTTGFSIGAGASRVVSFGKRGGRTLLGGYSGRAPVIFLYALIIAIVVAAAFWSPSFWSEGNLIDLLRSSIVIGLVAIGQMIVVTTGGIDFSIGVTAAFVGVVAAKLFGVFDGDIVIVSILALGVGAGIGLVNGLLVGARNESPFIITFGMYFVLTGMILVVSATPVSGVPDSYLNLYDATLGGRLPWCIVAIAGVWTITWLLMNRTRFGRALYAIGGSQSSARLAGINVRWTLLRAYGMCGMFGAAAGLFILARSGVADVTANGLEFASIVAVAVGGVSLFGGVGSVVGVLGGVLLLTIIRNLLIIGNVSEFYQQLVTGAIILIAVATFKQRRGGEL